MEEGKCSIRLIYPFGTEQGSVVTGSGTPGVVAGVWYQTGALFQGVHEEWGFEGCV